MDANYGARATLARHLGREVVCRAMQCSKRKRGPASIFGWRISIALPAVDPQRWRTVKARRGRDSNPREACHLCSLSKRVPSTARPPLQPHSTSSIGGPSCFKRRSARSRAPRPPAAKPLGPPPRLRIAVVGALLPLLLVGAAPAREQRHAVTGHFNVPRLQARVPHRIAIEQRRYELGFESGSDRRRLVPMRRRQRLRHQRTSVSWAGTKSIPARERRGRTARQLRRLPTRDDSAGRCAYGAALSALQRKRHHICVPRGRSARRSRQRGRESL